MRIADKAGHTRTVSALGSMLERSGGIDTGDRQVLKWADPWMSR
jgi:hypothetical protein